MQDELGKVLHFLILENNGETWEITSDQEIATSSSYGDVIDRNCLDGKCVKEEDSVFFREYDGTYEFFYEEYDTGIIGDGQEWFFKGFRLEDGNLEVIDETDELYFSGSPIDLLWENFEGDYSNELESFCSLGFASPEVYFDNMTVDNNDCLYRILRMVRDTTCSSEAISQWMGNSSQERLDGFTCAIEDYAEELPESIEEFSVNSHPISNQSSTAAQQSEDTSFYGIWCYGSKEEGEANSYAETLKASGFDARVYVTTDWSNLNTEKFYVVTAGVYSTESEANANLTSVQSVCQEAYVKYSGNYMG